MCVRQSVGSSVGLLVKSSKQGQGGMHTGRQAGRQGKQKSKKSNIRFLIKQIVFQVFQCLASFVLILVFDHVSRRT